MKTKLYARANMTITKSVGDDGVDVYTACASDMTVDRYGEVIDIKGWDIINYLKNPVMLWAHDASIPPIAKTTKIWVDGEKLMHSFVFAMTQFAQEIKTLVDGGFVNAESVGFMGNKQEGNIFTQQELFEISLVSIPANPNALLLDFCEKNHLDLIIKAINNNLTKKDLMKKKTIEKEEKGAVQDVLNTPEGDWEVKYNNMDSVYDVFYAFCGAYFAATTTSDQFIPLLTEMVSIMQTVIDGTYVDADDESGDNDEGDIVMTNLQIKKVFSKEKMQNFLEQKDGIVFSKEDLETFKKGIAEKIEQKAGKIISAANQEIIQKAIDTMDTCHGHMNDSQECLKGLLEATNSDEKQAGRSEVKIADNDLSPEDRKKKAKANLLRALQLLNK